MLTWARLSLWGAPLLGLVAVSGFVSDARAQGRRTGAAPSARKSQTVDVAFVDNKVLPVLKANCVACHSGDYPSGQLDLSSRAGLLRGGVSGPAVDRAKPESSRLLR
ncbi:MAG: c-type cytochrome domain-containing protein, partial [Armatimonadaceae bacterium]